MSGTSFTKKRIDVEFTMPSGKTLSVQNHRVSCQVSNAGLDTGSICNLRIEGMLISDMNLLSQIQPTIVQQNLNSVVVKAGNENDTLNTIFQGPVVDAFVDFSGAPNVAFQVMASSMAETAANNITPTSYPNGTSVSSIMRAISQKCGINFINNGVKATTSGAVYLSGSGAQQIAVLSSATNIPYILALNTLMIWPTDLGKITKADNYISAQTGMIGYPEYSQYGVTITTLFNHSIGFYSSIKLDSQYAPAAWTNFNGQIQRLSPQAVMPPYNGIWIVTNVYHDIASQTPNANWQTVITAARPQFAGDVATYAQ